MLEQLKCQQPKMNIKIGSQLSLIKQPKFPVVSVHLGCSEPQVVLKEHDII